MGGGYSGVNFGHLKSEVFQNGGGVGGAFWSEIPERGFLENLDKNLLFSQKPACASQIVSHILRMWRLTRWYPWGIQRLVSTYSNLYMGWGGQKSYSLKLGVGDGGWCEIGQMWTQRKKFEFGGGRSDVKCQNPKCQDLSKFQYSGGGGVMWNQISLQGWSEEFGQNFLEAQLAFASQIVSHILRMWRLTNNYSSQCALMCSPRRKTVSQTDRRD